MKTLIACIDNSAATRPVLTAAGALARVLDASVEALHVAEDGDATVRAATDAAGVPLRIAHGDLLGELLAAVTADGVVGVAVGARDLPLGRAAGHVALELANHVECPVLVVPPGAEPSARVQRVLIAMGGTTERARQLKSAVELASNAGLELIVVHVDDESSLPSFSDQVQHETSSYEHEFLARFVQGAPRARLVLRVGVPVDEILDVAKSIEPDIVAMGWPQTDEPGRGDVAGAVLERCCYPMLLVALAD